MYEYSYSYPYIFPILINNIYNLMLCNICYKYLHYDVRIFYNIY